MRPPYDRSVAEQTRWDYHNHAMDMSSDETRSHIGIMSGTSDPKAPIHIPSASSKALFRLLGVQYDSQIANRIVGREVQQFEMLRLFPTFDGSLPV